MVNLGKQCVQLQAGFKLVCCMGESLLDLTGSGIKGDASKSGKLLVAPGGGVSNVAIALARLKIPVSLITKFGDDAIGRYLNAELIREGVDTSGVTISKTHPTSIVLVELDKKANPEFTLYGYPGADNMITTDDIKASHIRGSSIFHFSSVTLVHPCSRAATLKAVKLARSFGAITSFDTNIRLHMWKSHELAKRQALKCVKLSDIVKVNLEEARFITGVSGQKSAATRILEMGPKLVALTLGSRGAALAWKDGYIKLPAYPTKVVDTTGAGDAFTAGLIKALLDIGWPEKENRITMKKVLDYALACSSLATSKPGAGASMPTSLKLDTMF